MKLLFECKVSNFFDRQEDPVKLLRKVNKELIGILPGVEVSESVSEIYKRIIIIQK